MADRNQMFSELYGALSAAVVALEDELKDTSSKSETLHSHTKAFLEPAIEKFRQALVLTKSMKSTDVDQATVLKRLSSVLGSLDDHIVDRISKTVHFPVLQRILDPDAAPAATAPTAEYDYILNAGPGQRSHPGRYPTVDAAFDAARLWPEYRRAEVHQVVDAGKTAAIVVGDMSASIHRVEKANAMENTKYTLLNRLNALKESDTKFEVEGVNKTGSHGGDLHSKIKVPDVVKTALKDRIRELEAALANQIKFEGRTDWAVDVPGLEFPAAHRIRRGRDAAIGLLEWIAAAFDKDTIEYNDLREVAIKVSTYGNVISQKIPTEVTQFLISAGRWNKWKEDPKFGKALPNADSVTGFVKPTTGKN